MSDVIPLRRGLGCTCTRPNTPGKRPQDCDRPASHAFAIHPCMSEYLAGIGGFACDGCADELRARAGDASLTTTTEVSQLSAGVLAALAESVPRCNMLVCVSAVARWGQTCEACSVRVLALAESIGALDETLASAGILRGPRLVQMAPSAPTGCAS